MSNPKKNSHNSRGSALSGYKNKYANYDNMLTSCHIGEIQKLWKKEYKSIDEQVFLHEGKLYVNDSYSISISQNNNNQNQGPKITNSEQNYELIAKNVYITKNQLMISYPEIKKNHKTLIYYINLQFNYIVEKCQSLHHDNQKYFGFSIKKYDQSFNFYQTDKKAIYKWVKLLMRYSIQNIVVFDQQYKIVNQIGKGSASCVYKVVFNNKEQLNEQEGKQKIPSFAAKVCYKHKLEKNVLDMIIDGIKNEIQILQSCNGNNNIISLYQVYEGKKQIVQILELVKYGDLFQLLKEQKCLNENYIHAIFVQLNQALLLLNKKNIVHRDIKLTNVLLLKNDKFEPVIRLADFGLAIVYVEGKTERMTQRCGTLGFMAPEMFTSKNGYDQQVDIFATGVMLYIMYNGSRPFKGQNEQEIVNNTIKTSLDFKRSQWTYASEHFIDLIKKMTIKNPKNRITIQQIQLHPWMNQFNNKKEALSQCSVYEGKQYDFDDDVEFPTKTFCLGKMKQIEVSSQSSPNENNVNKHLSGCASASNIRSDSLNLNQKHPQLDANQKQHQHSKKAKSIGQGINNGNLPINHNNQKPPTSQKQIQPQNQSSLQQIRQNNHQNLKIQIDDKSCSSQDNSFNEQFFQKLQLDSNLQSPSNGILSTNSLKPEPVFFNQQLNSPQNMIKEPQHNIISTAMKLQSKQKQIQQQKIDANQNNQYGNNEESDYDAILMDENYQVFQKIAKYQINVQIKNNFANGGNSSLLKIEQVIKQQKLRKNSSV